MTARVTFNECIQDSQEYGSDDEFMVSRVFFTLEVGGRRVAGAHVNMKQAAGGNFEKDPIEVGPVEGTHFRGPFNYAAFRDEAEKYYRELVGTQGRGIRIEGATNVRMRNNRLPFMKQVEFEVGTEEAGW